jgi:chromosome segregation ATPase
MRTDRAEQALADQRERADALQERIAGLLSQIAASEAEAKTAHDRAWASGEAAGALQKQLAATEGRFDAERKRAERAEKRADGDRQALLDAESKTWRTLAALEAAHKQSKQLQAKLAEAEVAAETAIRSANAVRQEDEARRGRGLLPRLLATWRGK